MIKQNKHEQGFAFLEVILVLLTLAIIGVGGYFVAKHVDNKPTAAVVTVNKTTSATPTKSTATKTVVTLNPYTGWLSVCSSYGGLCLKYPSTWKLTQQSPTLPTYPATGYSIASPDGNVEVNYYPSGTGAYFPAAGVYTGNILSLTSPSSTQNLKLVEETITGYQNWLPSADQYSYHASLFVTSNAAVQQNNLAAGKTVTANNGPNDYIAFTNPSSSNPKANQWLFAAATNNSYPISSLADAQAWLNTSDVKTANQILASVSYN